MIGKGESANQKGIFRSRRFVISSFRAFVIRYSLLNLPLWILLCSSPAFCIISTNSFDGFLVDRRMIIMKEVGRHSGQDQEAFSRIVVEFRCTVNTPPTPRRMHRDYFCNKPPGNGHFSILQCHTKSCAPMPDLGFKYLIFNIN